MNLYHPVPQEVADKMGEIMAFAVKHNDPHNTDIGYGIQFFVNLAAHVEWFEVEVAYKHFSVKIYERKIGYRCNAADDLESSTNEILDSLEGVLADMKKMADGKFNVEAKVKIS